MCQFQGYNKKCDLKSLNGRLMDAHEVCCSIASAYAPAPGSKAVEIVSKEQQVFHAEYDGRYMSQIHSKFCQGTRNHFEKLLNECGRAHRNDAGQCLTKNCQQSGNGDG